MNEALSFMFIAGTLYLFKGTTVVWNSKCNAVEELVEYFPGYYAVDADRSWVLPWLKGE